MSRTGGEKPDNGAVDEGSDPRTSELIEVETGEQVQDLLATMLAGVAGGTKREWLRRIGPVERLPTWRYVKFNWRVTPSGDAAQNEAIEKAVEIVRPAHPYIR